jgi:hypothetical protein
MWPLFRSSRQARRRCSVAWRPRLEALEDRVVPAFPATLTLNNLGTLGFTASGFEDGADAGASVSGAGDINGDGFDDFILGAQFTAAGGSDRGEAYVVFGGSGLAGSTLTLNALGNQGFTLPGFEDDAFASISVSGGGDVNGDGFDDLLIGASLTDAGGTDRGEAYVVFGGSGLGGGTLTLNALGSQGFTLSGFEDNALAGVNVSGGGDVNGDGFDDLLIGASPTDAGGTDRGEAYVVFGGSGLGGGTLTLNALGTQGFTLKGFEDGAFAGYGVSGAGDVNGDGFDDLIVGADSADAGGNNRGETYVVFGGSGLRGSTLTLNALGSQGFTLSGFEDDAHAGESVSGAGDVNGDGFDDLLVGAYGTDAGGDRRGEAYVVFGGSGLGGATLTLNALGSQGFTLRGFEDGALAGWSVSGGGDVNGDGIDDFLLGALRTDAGGTDRGEVYVVFGQDDTPPTAALASAPDVNSASDASRYEFTVTFADNGKIDVSTLDGNDVRVTGPGGFDAPATLVSVDVASDGSPRTATYRITPPGGAWDPADDGTYTVSLQPGQVLDVAGNPAPAADLGTFAVDVTAPPPPPPPPPPGAAGNATAGVFDPATGMWYLRDSNSAGAPDIEPFAYGLPGWIAVVGDWDGDGIDTIGVLDPTTMTWYLRNSNSPGAPDVTPFAYGGVGWQVVVGDWDGDGIDSVGVIDPGGLWYLRNANSPGAPDLVPFAYGLGGWLAVVGDWDGDGIDSVGMVDPGSQTWYLRNSNSAGAPDVAPFAYGAVGWGVLVGDWDGDGDDTIGVFDPLAVTWLLRNETNAGAPDVEPFPYGVGVWQPLAGNFL